MQMRRKTWVRRACFALAFLACFAVPGCAPAPNAAPAGSRDAPAGEKTVFTICVDSEADKTFYKTLHGGLANQFPQVTFEFVRAWNAGGPGAQAAANYEAAMTKLRTEIMSGRGPDLFVLNAINLRLIQDPDKQMRAGVFADLAPYLDTIAAEATLNETVLTAGRVGEAQYLLPLYYTVPGVAVPAEALAGFDAGENPSPADFLEKLLAHCDTPGFAPLGGLSADGLAYAPALDYEARAAALNEDQLALAALLADTEAWTRATGFQVWIPARGVPSAEIPFDACELGAGYLERQSLSLMDQKIDPIVLPIPNGNGGATASVELYAGVRANSPHIQLAAEMLAWLLRPEALKQMNGTTYPYTYSVNEDAVQELTENFCRAYRTERQKLGEDVPYTEADCDALAQQFTEAARAVNTARFTNMSGNALRRLVIGPVARGEATLEEAAADFAAEYRFYFDE